MLIWAFKNPCSKNAKIMPQGGSRTVLHLIIFKDMKD